MQKNIERKKVYDNRLQEKTRTVMSLFLLCKIITLVLLVEVSCNPNEDCKTIPNCEMDCYTIGPSYRCNRRGLIEVPSFPESTGEMYVAIV